MISPRHEHRTVSGLFLTVAAIGGSLAFAQSAMVLFLRQQVGVPEALVPNHLMGTVVGLGGTFISCVTVTTSLLGGLAGRAGLRISYLVAAAVIAATALATRPLLRRVDAELLAQRQARGGVGTRR